MNGGPAIGFETDAVLTDEEVSPIFRLKKGEEGEVQKEKVLNLFGIYTIFVSILTSVPWAMAMVVVDAICSKFPDLDPNRNFFDGTGKVWAKSWLTLTNSFPTVSGDLSWLEADNGKTCLYVANHGSWLDIPVLCTVLDPVFKFIAKGELRSLPCVGHQLTGGKHILIDREDRRSQLRTFKEGITWLKNDVPLMAFPEGQRSPDGKLMKFKGGIFSMAIKAGVPIVPISISNTHAIYPANSLMPVQNGKGKLHVHVHEPIEAVGRTDKELSELVRTALLSKMPLHQHPDPEPIVEMEKPDIVILEEGTTKASSKTTDVVKDNEKASGAAV
jgi:1-acyl-sn-glycerol-3-phosphate acyltransferase